MALGLTLEQLCGQLLVCGWEGPELPPSLLASLQAGERGGLIAFRRNLPDLETALRVNATAIGTTPEELPPLLGIDEEGGRVSRLPAPFRALPPMRRLGAQGDRDLCIRAGAALGRVLGALGYSVDFAPVLDVDTNPANPIIGDRAFGAKSAEVIDFGLAFAQGLAQAPIAPCGKHFPGHGDTLLDSHLALPTVAHDLRRLQEVELAPFAAAATAGLPALMSAHVVFSALDPGIPATLSHRIATELLRDQLGFDGILISDDLEMGALTEQMTIEESAVRAISAGCDLLLVCRDAALQCRAHAALVARARQDEDFRRRCEDAAARALRVRRRTPPRPGTVKGALARASELEVLGAELTSA